MFLLLQNMVFDDGRDVGLGEIKVRSEPGALYVVVVLNDSQIEEEIKKQIEATGAAFSSVVSASVNIQDKVYLGYIYRCDDPIKQRKFYTAIQTVTALEEVEKERNQ